MRKLTEEAIRLFDGETRSFNELYKDKADLFEDCDDLIDPKFRKLFEATYDQAGNLRTTSRRLRENEECCDDCDDKEELNESQENLFEAIYRESEADYNFSGDEPGPSGDGVPAAHNRAGMGGADPATTQGQGRGESNNAGGLFTK